jgi:hypothetical protein
VEICSARPACSTVRISEGFPWKRRRGLAIVREVAKALGVGLGGVKTLVHRLRERYRSILREEIARTMSDPAEIEDEVHVLCEAVVASGGRLAP